MTLSHHTTSKSQVETYGAERKALGLATAGVFAAGATYIAVMLVAVPFAVHKIVNDPDETGDCVGPCFGATSESQGVLTNVLTTLRLCTFFFGNLLGVLGDKYGRRPVMMGALAGYTVASLVFFFAWQARSVELFFVGAALLGCASPLNPHGVAYVSDISAPKRAAQNIGILQGFGYFAGLMTGALIARLIASVSVDKAEAGAEPSIALYDQLFLDSFFGGFGISVAFVVVFIFFLPESLHLEERSEVQWKLANPFGIIPVITRNGYMFFIWLMCFFSWISIGGGEAITGGWWLRRYAISDSGVYISFLVVLWVLAGFGAVIMTKVFTMKGLKIGVHLSSIGAISAAIALSMAPDVGTSYIAAGVGFFGSAAMPIYLVIFMGQAAPNEKGLFSGTYRTSEALAKIIGIQVMGNLFAEEIKEFQPDESCVADNSCVCGIESCPQYFSAENGGTRRVPKFCTLGQLSTVWSAEPGLTPLPSVALSALRPELLADGSKNPNHENCKMPGNRGGGGLNATLNKLWCSGSPILGCFGPVDGFCALGCLLGRDLEANGTETSCTSAFHKGTECNLVPDSPYNETAETFATDFQANGYTTLVDDVMATFLNPETHPRDHHCEKEDGSSEWEANLCWEGTISDFPGLMPFLLSIFLMLGYASFIIAEVFFIDGDARHWVKDEDEKMMDGDGAAAPVSSPAAMGDGTDEDNKKIEDAA